MASPRMDQRLLDGLARLGRAAKTGSTTALVFAVIWSMLYVLTALSVKISSVISMVLF